jgi:TonB-linked SusC/RagA family outer membrane protein
MKLTTILIIASMLQLSAATHAQNITMNKKNVQLSMVFKAIRKQTGYNVIWKPQNLDASVRVDANFNNTPLDEVMNACLPDKFTYVVDEKTILITRAKKITQNISVAVAVDVQGAILDENGKGIPGATIRVKGTESATMSDINGRFSLNGINEEAILVVSFLGYSTQEIKITSNMTIKLAPKLNSLNEVIVVGYGTQKKIDLSGSVSSVSGKTLTERPVANLANLLEGRIAGLTVVQPTGEPGLDQGSLQVRGLGSYGASASPLVLVDGIAGSLNNLSPQDIESVTVLKDAASSSIYGSRAANGVILVTTKKGKNGTNTIEYSNSFGTTSATVLPKFITNSATYMAMYNEALERAGRPDVYTQAQINSYASANNNPQYPNTDWIKYYFHSAPVQNHNLIASGGDSISTYYISAGYQNQKGILDGYDYNRYNSVMNYTRKVNKRVSIGTNINLLYEKRLSPTFTNDGAVLLIYAQAPTFAPTLPDGSGRVAVRDYINNGTTNATLYERQNYGFQLSNNYNINAQGYININIIKGLDWKTTGAFVFYNDAYKTRQYQKPFDIYAFQPDASGNYVQVQRALTSSLKDTWDRDLTLTVNSTLNFDKNFGTDHHIGALAGYEQISDNTTYINGDRNSFTSNTINELNGGPITGWDNGGDTYEYALQSLFGRVNYNYKHKYFLQGDIRYDGTSRVNPTYRWGTFGGGSAAYSISEEKFIKNNFTWINSLKLRAAYGVLGNQQIGNYPYQQILSPTSYPFTTSLSSGQSLNSLATANLKWENTAITDFGLDINIFNGLLGLTADWYYKNTTGILTQSAGLPASVGLNPPVVNAGSMVNKGFEFELTHENRIGDFTYGANVIFSLNRNKVTQVLSPNPGVFQVGLPYNSFYVYEFDGIFNSQQEINNSPKQPNSGTLKPGDIKIKDTNGNGVIDPGDRVSISQYPSYTYSFGVNAGWKNFKLTTFFQGVQGQKIYVNGWGIDPFYQGGAPTTDFLNAWTPQNLSQTTPAVYQQGYAGVDGYNSTYFLKDASYLRLKNINLSYSFPQNMLKSIWVKGLTVFVSGDNLVTWTKYVGEDPERASTSGRYAQFPQLKIYSAGLKVSL